MLTLTFSDTIFITQYKFVSGSKPLNVKVAVVDRRGWSLQDDL